MSTIQIDKFSGTASDIPKKQMTPKNVLFCFSKNPMVSTFDLSENKLLCQCIDELKEKDMIRNIDCDYPWIKFAIQPNGIKFMFAAI